VALSPLLTPRTYYSETIINTPANTNSFATTIDVGLKVLQRITVLWPPGQNALIGVAAVLDGVWILPWNQTGAFVFDSGNRRTFDVGLLLDHPIVIRTHNGTPQVHQTFVTLEYTDPELQGDTTTAAPLPVLSVV
jgi:hypothetical protein